MPATIKLGSAYDIYRDRESKNMWTVAADVVKPLKDNIRMHVGMEFGYRDFAFIRAGYQFGYETRSFAAGLGLKLVRNIRVDYGYVPFSHALGATHRISAGFDF